MKCTHLRVTHPRSRIARGLYLLFFKLLKDFFLISSLIHANYNYRRSLQTQTCLVLFLNTLFIYSCADLRHTGTQYSAALKLRAIFLNNSAMVTHSRIVTHCMEISHKLADFIGALVLLDSIYFHTARHNRQNQRLDWGESRGPYWV